MTQFFVDVRLDLIDDESLIEEVCRRGLKSKVAKYPKPSGGWDYLSGGYVTLSIDAIPNDVLVSEMDWRKWLGVIK